MKYGFDDFLFHSNRSFHRNLYLIKFNDTLEHYGVKGMKWGCRKSKNKQVKKILNKYSNKKIKYKKRKLSPIEYKKVMGYIASDAKEHYNDRPRIFYKIVDDYEYKVLNNFDGSYDLIGARKLKNKRRDDKR